jgi:hypothetical protein
MSEPWAVDWGFADWGLRGSHQIREGDSVVAEIPFTQPYCMGASPEDREAATKQKERACLISAAPELLAAAKLALEDCCDLLETKAGNALRAAIAKADGVSE